jgi:Ni,Fe-hydrogenase III small subunit
LGIVCSWLLISKGENDNTWCGMMVRGCADRAVEVITAVLMMMESLDKGSHNEQKQEDKG